MNTADIPADSLDGVVKTARGSVPFPGGARRVSKKVPSHNIIDLCDSDEEQNEGDMCEINPAYAVSICEKSFQTRDFRWVLFKRGKGAKCWWPTRTMTPSEKIVNPHVENSSDDYVAFLGTPYTAKMSEVKKNLSQARRKKRNRCVCSSGNS